MHKRITNLLSETQAYEDSKEVVDQLLAAALHPAADAYPLNEAATHLLGLWAHTKRLHRELERAIAAAPQHPPRLIKLSQVKALTTLSTSELYRRIAAGAFPRQVMLGPKSAVWIEAEVLEWMEALIGERSAA